MTVHHHYIVTTTIAKIEQRFVRRYISGFGPDTIMENISTGWWIVMAALESYAVCVGDERPTFEVGQEVKWILEI